MPESPSNESLRELVQNIAKRVRSVCTHMPAEEFRALVEQMARVEQKYIHYPNAVPRGLQDVSSIWQDSPTA